MLPVFSGPKWPMFPCRGFFRKNKFLHCPRMQQCSCVHSCRYKFLPLRNSSPVHAYECHAEKSESSPYSCSYKLPHAEVNSSPVHAHEWHADKGEVSPYSWHCPSFSEQLVCTTHRKQPANSVSSMNWQCPLCSMLYVNTTQRKQPVLRIQLAAQLCCLSPSHHLSFHEGCHTLGTHPHFTAFPTVSIASAEVGLQASAMPSPVCP